MDNKVVYTVTANDLLSGKIAGMNAEANKLDGTMAGLQGTIGKVGGVLAGVFAIGQIKSFIGSVIDAGSAVENATTGLTTLLGDAAAAGQVVKNTMEDATKTPFAFEGLLAANKALIGAGVEAGRARGDVLNLANAIAATGGGDDELSRMVVNMQQIRNTGKASALDIKQFAFAGVNIYKVLAEATGQSIDKVKDMEVSYDLLTAALAKAHDKGGIYYNGLENMANNTSVQISNLGDATFQFMVQIFEDFKPLIQGTIEFLGDMVDKLRDAYTWAKENKEIFRAVGAGLLIIAGAYSVMLIRQKMIALWSGIVKAALLSEAFTAGTISAAYAGASTMGQIFAGTMSVINAVLAANPIGAVIAAIAALVAAFVYLWNTCEGFRAFFFGLWEAIKTIGSLMMQFFVGLKNTIVGAFELDDAKVAKGLSDMAGAFKNGGTKIANSFREGYKDGIADFHKDQKSEEQAGAKKTGLATVKPINPGTGAVKPKETKSVTGSKSVTVNVSIGSLIHDFTIKTTNIQESTTAIKEKVIQALTSAVNDSQIAAD